MKTKNRIFWKWSPSRKVRRHRSRQWWRHFDRVTETRELLKRQNYKAKTSLREYGVYVTA